MDEQTQPLVLPWDGYNQKLVSNVHPQDWRNPTPVKRYNLVVIGGGAMVPGKRFVKVVSLERIVRFDWP